MLADYISEMKLWSESYQGLCHLFVDAASTPSRVAAVLCIDGEMFYTDAEPGWSLMRQLHDRMASLSKNV